MIYGNLIGLLLEEGDKNEKEIINEVVNRFGFPEDSYSMIKIQLLMEEKNGYIKKFSDGKYHLTKLNDDPITGRRSLLIILRAVAPKDYLEERPWLNKLKEALEEKML